MRLADRLYLAAHHDVTGRPRAHHRAISDALAAALIGELLYDRRISVEQGRVRLLETTPLPDALANTVLHPISVEPQHTAVALWLAFLAHDSREQVARRLYGLGRSGASRCVLCCAPS